MIRYFFKKEKGINIARLSMYQKLKKRISRISSCTDAGSHFESDKAVFHRGDWMHVDLCER